MVRRFISCLLVAVVLALPFRGMAAHADSAQPAQSHEMPCHGHDGPEAEADSKANQPCNSCDGSHCCSGFLAQVALVVPAERAAIVRIRSGEQFRAGLVLDHLDPPPLVL